MGHGRSRVGQHGGMPTGDNDDPSRVRSWITPKAVKGGASAIAGRGVHAVETIAGGEVVAVKGGHIVDGCAVAGLPDAIRNSAFPIGPDLFLAALTRDEYDGVMMRVNHSCEPDVGMGGNVLLVSMRDIAPGEELTIDYALFPWGSWLRHGLPVRNRGLPGGGDGIGLDARRLAGTLPGMVFLVAPAEDRSNPGPPGPIAVLRRAAQRLQRQGVLFLGAERWWAAAAACRRLVTPSLRRILDTCTLAVFSLM
jgi:uncharacterized protein